MTGRECYHCKQWVEEGEAHDCWTTTERALTSDLSEELQDAYERFREAAVDLGEQRVYASHSSVMFSRKACHFFVRPKRKHLEVVIFLGRAVKAPQVRKVETSSKAKRAHFLNITHRDQVEAPITDWMREAYELQDRSLKAAVEKRPKKAAGRTVKKAKKAPRKKAKKR